MRKFFEVLSIFDWVTPTIGLTETFVHDPTPLQSNSWTFFIPYNTAQRSGWNERGIRAILDQNGISSWGSQITNGELFFSVGLDQAQWAEYLLLKQGVPISEKFMGAPAPKRKGWGR
jgi:hypothetical protein